MTSVKVILPPAETGLIYGVLSLLYEDLKETALLRAAPKCIWFKALNDECRGESRGT